MGRPNKYGAKKTTIGGIRFDSRAEAKRYTELQLLQKAGVIANLQRQVAIPLKGALGPILTPTGRKATYKADFVYVDLERNAEVIEDVKGFETPEYKLKRAILAAQGITIREIRK